MSAADTAQADAAPLQQELRALHHFARMLDPDAPPLDDALTALTDLLHAASLRPLIVGGAAVVHHGVLRTTRDLDWLTCKRDMTALRPHWARFAFARVRETRLLHEPSQVTVDLLFAGAPIPRRPERCYPHPDKAGRSARDPRFVDLPTLIELKLYAGRHQDQADVVALLKRMDEGGYLSVEAALPARLRAALFTLRQDALEELSWESDD